MKRAYIYVLIFIIPVTLQLFILLNAINNREWSYFLYSVTVLLLTVVIMLVTNSVSIKQKNIEKLKQLERTRSEFVSNVTHELKTPLTSIVGFTETLRNGALNDKAVAMHFLDIIDMEADRLRTLINGVLLLGEVENTKADVDVTVFELNDIVEHCLELLQYHANERSIKLFYHVEGSIFVDANSNRIEQLLLNLMNNAIKFNKPNGEVHVTTIAAAGNNLTIRVSDTGCGIAEENIPNLFDRFYRAETASDISGSGLGLSIVKHIVEMYDGTITVTSALGKGSEFVVSLPIIWDRTVDNKSL